MDVEKCIIVWDLETTELIDKKRIQIQDMEVSVACAILFETTDTKLENVLRKTFWNDAVLAEDSLDDLGELLSRCRGHVAYNGMNFDMVVMQKHFQTANAYSMAMQRLFDPLQDLKNLSYFSLNALLAANNLGAKTASGKEAPSMWREKRFQTLEAYCMSDVELLAKLVTQSSSIALPGLEARVPLSISQLLFPLDFEPIDTDAKSGDKTIVSVNVSPHNAACHPSAASTSKSANSQKSPAD